MKIIEQTPKHKAEPEGVKDQEDEKISSQGIDAIK